jgi:hypothetical protein
MQSDLTGRITLLEARISLLERRSRRGDQSRAMDAKPVGTTTGPMSCSVDQPGLMICDAYGIECDEDGRLYCWVGGFERLQFVFPHSPDRRQICCMSLLPHPRVDFERLRVVVNDEGQKHRLAPANDDLMQLKFPVDDVGTPTVNVLLLNLHGVRPKEIGENDDDRLLTARFYGAEFAEA